MPNFKRTRNLFDPSAKAPFKLSRTRLENFINCPRCFYLDRRLGIEPPGMPAFTLNNAVDALLKKEFNIYRQKKTPHPLMTQCGIPMIPFDHPQMDEWRETFQGIQFHHKKTNLIMTGAVDDLWVDKDKQLYVVDFKATSTEAPITLDGPYRQAYKRQMEIYQWLLRGLDFKVSNTGYFVFCNAKKSKEAFNAQLDFDLNVIAYEGSDDWVEEVVIKARECLHQEVIPPYTKGCPFCEYRKNAYQSEDVLREISPKKEEGIQRELFPLVFLTLYLANAFAGCMNFTQRDYDLQKKAYEREQQEKEAKKQGSIHAQW